MSSALIVHKKLGGHVLKIVILLALSFQSFAVCEKWSGPEVIGSLDSKLINESSGIAISKKFQNRMYHINDSGSGAFFYITDLHGSQTKKISINNFKPYDMEDAAIGKCGDSSCLYIADIGDNRKKRDYLSILAIKEKRFFKDGANPLFQLKLRYPNIKYDAESFVVHPDGSLYLLTKIVDDENRRAMPAVLFKVEASEVEKSIEKGEHSVVLKEVATLDLPYQLYNYNLWGRIPTAMDLSQDGKTLVILTYSAVFEFNIDLNNLKNYNLRSLDPKKDYRIITTKDLFQQEAISYNDQEREIIYTTEVEKEGDVSQIVRHSCLNEFNE